MQEREPDGGGEEHRQADGERWGPPRRGIDRPTAILAGVAFAAALLAQIFTFGLSLTPDRYLLVLLAPALVIGRGRRFLLDWVPFVALIVLYEESRGIAHTLNPIPYYQPQIDAEKFLFFGHIPTEVLQHWWWTGHLQWYDEFLSSMTRVHFIVPPTLAFFLWLKRRALYYRFAATLLALSYAGSITFGLYPAAPPWAAAQTGRIPPLANPAGAQAASSPLPTDSGPLYHLVSGNNYAAIPSLHEGYAMLVFLFIVLYAWNTRWRWPVFAIALLYPIVQSIAVIYTANHYVVDLIIGAAYAFAAVFGVRRLWRRLGWPE